MVLAKKATEMTTDPQQGIHTIITGQVQGVWFRASTQACAQKLQLHGWVRNLPTGQVELKAFGSQAALKQLSTWLWQGPELATVSDVQQSVIPYEDHPDFSLR
jgi:acylphosphatase